MDARMELISNCFDIRGFNKKCNFHNCMKVPEKEALIMELDSKKQQRKELVSLYFCNKHFDICIKDLLNQLNKLCESGKSVYMEMYEIGSR
ncbi:MAG: hypothetical protein QXN71_00370 [Candidatus Aenigmatarchaeota archaeon]